MARTEGPRNRSGDPFTPNRIQEFSSRRSDRISDSHLKLPRSLESDRQEFDVSHVFTNSRKNETRYPTFGFITLTTFGREELE